MGLLLAACSAGGEEEPSPESNVLIYANLNPDGADRAAIRKFNATHEEIQIEVRDYTDGGGQDGRQGRDLLMTEIMAGHIPDIIDMGTDWGEAGQFPYRQMAQKGYLTDLWPYIENDPDLGRERLLEAPLKAAEVEGGLYMVFDSVQINTLIGPESMVGDRYSWSLDELMDAFASMPEDSTILEYIYDKYSMFYYMLGMSLESYVDWETGKCSFDSEKFRNALAFINENYLTNFDWSVNPSELVNEEIDRRRQSGRQMLSVGLLYEPGCVRFLDAQFGERIAFIGYPVEDGSVGSSFRPGNRKLAMSSACQNKELAWEFMRQTLLPRYSAARSTTNMPFSIPVNRADYIWWKSKTGGERDAQIFFNGPAIKLPQASTDDYQRFEDFFNSIEKIDMCDSNIYQIVYELCGPYFSGDKTLDETVDLIQRRVGLYVNEQK